MRRPALPRFFLAAIGAAPLALGQTGPPAGSTPGPVTERIGVSLVEVPVSVLDSSGAPVPGLQARDFHIFDDGRPVEIEALDIEEYSAPVHARAGRAAAPASRARASVARRFLVLFDQSFITGAELVRARDAARHFVREQMGMDDLAAVGVVSTKAASILQNFTRDRGALDLAIGKVSIPADTFRKTVIVGDATSGSRRGKYTGAELDRIEQAGRARDAGKMTDLLSGLDAISRWLGSVPGRKQVVYLSHGFDVMTDESWLLTPLSRVVEEMRRDDAIVHTVDLAGIRPAGEGGMAGASQNLLSDMAQETGGQFLTSSNDFSAQLGQILRATSVVYVLSFRPAPGGTPGRRHRLEVRVDRPGARVSARTAYLEPA